VTDRPKCKAKSARTGKPCSAYPINGGVVCGMHGGRAPQVKRKAAERLLDLIDPDRALREAASLAYSDLASFYDANGELKPMGEWTPAMRAAVRSIETLERDITPGERGPAAKVHKLQLWDKPKNLEMLFKHLGLLIERVEHSGSVDLVSKLQAARVRAGS
jgi:hypothetical protein